MFNYSIQWIIVIINTIYSIEAKVLIIIDCNRRPQPLGQNLLQLNLIRIRGVRGGGLIAGKAPSSSINDSVHYYEVDLHQDLWGEWLLAQVWGRRGTRLGPVRSVPCNSQAEGLARVDILLKRRWQHRYVMVAGVPLRDPAR